MPPVWPSVCMATSDAILRLLTSWQQKLLSRLPKYHQGREIFPHDLIFTRILHPRYSGYDSFNYRLGSGVLIPPRCS